MDTNQVWDLLSGIEVGTIVAWITVFCAIISAICTGTIKLYKLFTKYKNMKDSDDKLRKDVEDNKKELLELKEELANLGNDLANKLSSIQEALDEQRETKITELRHNLTNTGERALAEGKMTVRQYKSFHEMCDKYLNQYKQNSYVLSLKEKVDRDVMVIGCLDEHGNDIE